MAAIGGQTLPRDPKFANVKRRVVVKLKASSALQPLAAPKESLESLVLGDAWLAAARGRTDLRVQPYFRPLAAGDPGLLRAGDAPDSLSQFMSIECPDAASAEAVVTQARQSPEVERAYVEGGPTPPPVNPSDDPRFVNQRYSNSAPEGIDAQAMWALGFDGTGAELVDLEQGWTLEHEDLVCRQIPLISGLNHAYPGHGTAVLGQIVACDNAIGGVGIAPGATCRVISQWRAADAYSTALAIAEAASVMNPGAVLLLEAQTEYETMPGFLPVEVEEVVFESIRTAVAKGIVVVEAAGNGNNDLDAFVDEQGQAVLNRQNQGFRDSGAIMVGAATAGVPHQRTATSNHGSRVDCFAWGEAIDTTGDGFQGTGPSDYTTDFGGTSGASAIIAGAALLVQSLRTRQGAAPLTPAEMRAVFTANSNTPSGDPVDRIGVMPNLLAIIELVSAAPPAPPTASSSPATVI